MANGHVGLTWWVARLHPFLVFAALFFSSVLVIYLDEILINSGSHLRSFVLALHIAIVLIYPLFVILFVSGRFASPTPRRTKLPIAAFFAAQALPAWLAVGLVASTTSTDRDFSLIERVGLGTCWLATAFGFFYLLIGAAVALVRAERGVLGRGLQIFGAFLLFGYGPLFGYFFLHRRVRRLLKQHERRDLNLVELPMEKLTMEEGADRHLGLELTERIGSEGFEAYAGEILRRLDARVLNKASTVDMHLWDVEVETVPLRLVYEDTPNRVMLESDSFPGDMLLKKLQRRLAPAR